MSRCLPGWKSRDSKEPQLQAETGEQEVIVIGKWFLERPLLSIGGGAGYAENRGR